MKTVEEIIATKKVIVADKRDIKTGRFMKTHGLTKTRLFNIWAGMKNRCYNKNKKEYSRYGEKGIGICDEWRNNFMNFYRWALSNGYKENLTLDRIKNDKGYSPENCRWADRKTQTLNRSVTKFIEIDGKQYTVPDLSRIYGININCLYARARRHGYSPQIIKEGERNAKQSRNS